MHLPKTVFKSQDIYIIIKKFFSFFFRIYKYVKPDRKSKRENWKDDRPRTFENKINKAKKEMIKEIIRKGLKELKIIKTNKIKDIVEIGRELRWLEVKIIIERKKDELQEFEIKTSEA